MGRGQHKGAPGIAWTRIHSDGEEATASESREKSSTTDARCATLSMTDGASEGSTSQASAPTTVSGSPSMENVNMEKPAALIRFRRYGPPARLSVLLKPAGAAPVLLAMAVAMSHEREFSSVNASAAGSTARAR